MYLTETLTDCSGRQYPMVGAYPFKTRMLPRLKALGYREVVIAEENIYCAGGKDQGPRISLFGALRLCSRQENSNSLLYGRPEQYESIRGLSL